MTLPSLLAAASLAAASATPQSTIGRLFDAFNRHDAPALQALYARDARLTSSDFCRPRTGADVGRTYGAMFRAFPGIRDEVTDVVVEGDRAAVRFVTLGGPPRRRFRFELMTFFRFRGGRIIEDDTVFDTRGRPCEA